MACEIGIAYTGYLNSGFMLFTSLRNGTDPTDARQHLREAEAALRAQLSRRGIDFRARTDYTEADEALRGVRDEVLAELGNRICGLWGERSEKILNLTVLLAGILSVGGSLSQLPTPIRDAVLNSSQALGIPESIIDGFLREKQFEPLRRHLARHSGSSRVFVVHGRSEGPLQSVARVLAQLGFVPVILREQPNRGRALIQKFIDYSDVEFAVVVLSPDDVGRLRDEPSAELRPRPRQNVMFELGFFIGKLGGDRVCALYEGNTEIPSDYSGVAFVPYDSLGAWKLALANELREVGLTVDLNRL
jgi:hypothetical protein